MYPPTEKKVQAPGLTPSAPAAPKPGEGWVQTADGQGWLPPDRAGTPGAMPSAPAPAPAPGAPAGPAAPAAPQTTQQVLTGTPAAQGPPTTAAGAFQQALMKNLAPAPVTAQSASIAPQIQANSLAQQRGSERQRAQNAERNVAQGFNNSGGAVTEQIGLEQDRAAQEGQFAADAIAGQTDKDRQAQLILSQLVGGMLGGEDARGLQRYGIDQGTATQRYGIDKGADTSRYGIDTNASLGRNDLDLRDKLGSGSLNLGLAGLLQGGQQFGQSLASNNAQFGAGLNQQALLSLLGAL